MDKDKGVYSSELWVTAAGMIAVLITAYTGVPVTATMVLGALTLSYGVCRTVHKGIKNWRGKKGKDEGVTALPGLPPILSQEELKALMELANTLKKPTVMEGVPGIS